MTWVVMGNAEMPQAPIMGLIFFLTNRLMNLANSTPPTVSNTKANSPRAIISSVPPVRNWSACILVAMVMPRKMVMRFASTFCAVSDRLFSTPHSRSRLPNIKKPTNATLRGATRPAIAVTTMGNRMRTVRLISFASYGMRIIRSFLVVMARITGGWMMGTSAI